MPRKGTKKVDLRFPAGGLNRQYGYQAQAPYTTSSCMNVRPTDTLEKRERGGRRPGLVKEYTSRMSNNPIDLLQTVSYISSGSRLTKLFGICNGIPFVIKDNDLFSIVGNLCTESGEALLTEDSQNIVIDDVRFQHSGDLCASERGQKLYIADHGDVLVQGTDGVINSGNVFSSSSITDWSIYGLDYRRDFILIFPRDGSSVETKTVSFSDVNLGSTLSLESNFTNGPCSFIIVSGLKVFDPVNDSISILRSENSLIPYGVEHIVTYRDRIVVAGGFTWYMSKQGDPTDWNYGADPDDPSRAVSANNADAGLLGEIITAMITHSDDYIIFGCENSLWVMRGDPAFGGQLDNLSYQAGIVNKGSWCKLPDSSIIFLSRNGLYYLAPGARSFPVEFSDQVLPDELKNISGSNYISMSYDIEHNGIHLFITPTSGSGQHWWIDLDTRSFWPLMFIDESMQPTSVKLFAASQSATRKALIGCRDGHVRYFDNTSLTDDGESVHGFVIIGPFRFSGSSFDLALVSEITATIDNQSSDIDYVVRSGNDGEDVVHAGYVTNDSGNLVFNDDGLSVKNDDYIFNERSFGRWTGGKSKVDSCRVSAGSFGIRIEGSGLWSFESVGVMMSPAGKQRL